MDEYLKLLNEKLKLLIEKNVSEAVVSELKSRLPEKIKININTGKVAKEKEVKQREKLNTEESRENYVRKNKVLMEVKQKYKQGYSISKIADEMNLNRHTVSKYIGLKELPTTIRHQTVDLDKYKIKEMIDLMTNFRIVLFSKSEEKLKKWLEEAQKINSKKLNSVINGIKQDYQAVVNCINMLDYSNGPNEGKNNKNKIYKTFYVWKM